MGCFLACFSTCKPQKHHNSENPIPSSIDQGLKATEALQPVEQPKGESAGKLIKLIRESTEEVEEQVNYCAKKRVTFDLNVNTYEELPSAKDVNCDLVEKKSGDEEETRKEMEQLLGTFTLGKIACYTPNNRYQDCRKSTDDYEDIGIEERDLEDDDDECDCDCDSDYNKEIVMHEESSESLFSLSIDSRKHVCDADKGEKEVSSPMPISSFSEEKVKTIVSFRNAGKRSQFGQSVLKPIENLTQWKEEVKVERPISPLVKHQDKENISSEPSFELENHSSKPKLSEIIKAAEQEIGVDTSLSSWLVGSETTPKSIASTDHSLGNSESEKANSPSSPRDGPNLGVLVASQELKQSSDSSRSLKGSRSQSPDTTPLIGTVGSYWIHTGQNIDSDSSSPGRGRPITARENREDQTVNCKSTTPFDAKLGRAMDTGVC